MDPLLVVDSSPLLSLFSTPFHSIAVCNRVIEDLETQYLQGVSGTCHSKIATRDFQHEVSVKHYDLTHHMSYDVIHFFFAMQTLEKADTYSFKAVRRTPCIMLATVLI